MKTKKTLLLTLLLVSALVLSACGSTAQPAPAPEAAAPAEAAAEPEAAPAEEVPAEEAPAEEAAPAPAADTALPVRVITLNGTTGFGMAGLIAAHEAGETALNYTFTVETDASNATAALVSGDCDLAALPTNAASALYNKTGGKVQVLALNTRGVLYLVSDGSVPVTAFSDLEGQTVFAPAQNPSFIFRALCEANGVNVSIDNTYAQPAELNTAVAAGEVALAVLPEPLLTVARSQNQNLQVCLNLTEEWDRVNEPGSLVQGCIAVRTDFAAEHPEELRVFLAEYGDSVRLALEEPAEAAAAIEAAGIFAKAAVAQKALPNCNLCFVTGEEMQAQLSVFLEQMFAVAPESVGGAVPGDDFYCKLS